MLQEPAMKGPVRVGSIVADTPALSALIEHARRFEALEALVRSWLPATLAPHVGVANLREDTLILSVKSAAWATKLRYEVPTLLAAARRHAPTRDVRDIKIRVRVDSAAG